MADNDTFKMFLLPWPRADEHEHDPLMLLGMTEKEKRWVHIGLDTPTCLVVYSLAFELIGCTVTREDAAIRANAVLCSKYKTLRAIGQIEDQTWQNMTWVFESDQRHSPTGPEARRIGNFVRQKALQLIADTPTAPTTSTSSA